MPINWSGIETALIAWLQSSTGVVAGQVIFRHQQVPSLSPPTGTAGYLSLYIDGPTSLGSVDEIRSPYDAGQPLGQEVQQTVVGQREFSVSVQAYTVQERGVGTAREMLTNARTALSKPSQQALFAAVGASFVDVTPVDNLPILGPMGQGRAHMDIRFRTVDSVIDPTGYIATVGPDAQTGAPNPVGTLT